MAHGILRVSMPTLAGLAKPHLDRAGADDIPDATLLHRVLLLPETVEIAHGPYRDDQAPDRTNADLVLIVWSADIPEIPGEHRLPMILLVYYEDPDADGTTRLLCLEVHASSDYRRVHTIEVTPLKSKGRRRRSS